MCIYMCVCVCTYTCLQEYLFTSLVAADGELESYRLEFDLLGSNVELHLPSSEMNVEVLP